MTNITAVIRDPNGNVYTNALVIASFVGQSTVPGAGPYLIGGLPQGVFNPVVPGETDSSGNYAVSLPGVDSVQPTPSQWKFSVVSSTSPAVAFSVLITITGATQDISAALQAAAAPLTSPTAFQAITCTSLTDTGPANFLNGSTSPSVNIANGEVWVPPSGNIQAAINSLTTGIVRLQPGIYPLGNTGITLKNGVQLIGANESSSILTYTGTGAAVLMDSTTEAAVRRVQIQIGSSATAIGLDVQNTTADSKFNTIENVQIQTTGGVFTSGQIGIRYMCSTAFALYWNTMIACQTVKLDTGFKLTNLGAFTTNGCNDNKFYSLSAHFFTNGFVFEKFATENQIYGLTGSASGQVANNTLLVVGNSANAADGNMVFGLVADTGAGGQAYSITSGVGKTRLVGVYDAAGRASTNSGTATMVLGFANATSQADLYPNGSFSNPPIGDLAAPSTGILFSPGGLMQFSALGTDAGEISNAPAGYRFPNVGVLGWSSTAASDGTNDTGISRIAAGLVAIGTGAQGSKAGILTSGNTARLTADLTLAGNTNLQAIFSFVLPAVAGQYSFYVSIQYSQATAAVADAFGVQCSVTAPTNLVASAIVYTAAGTSTSGTSGNITTTTATNIVTFTPSATGTVFTAVIEGQVEVGASGGTLNIMASQSNAGDLLTIKRGSYAQLF